jgi:hypothetical protein
MKKTCRRFPSLLTLLCVAAAMTGATITSRAAAPNLSFTNLKAGQKLTNGVFTVTGKAAGAIGISNVLYSLNAAAWTHADGGSNWSAQVTLVPGSDTISAYAVDNSGKSSQKKTVKFIYYVTGTLTVVTHGPGTVKPDYNGKQLQLGRSYSMTAKSPARGFGLQSWTDASNNVVSTKATLKFIMASNLTFVANFGDVARPTIIVKNTTTNTDGVANHFYVNGTASDNVGVSNVFYQLSTVAATPTTWQTATGSTHWSASVSLSPGLNYFYAYAVDVNSNSSKMFNGQITYNSARQGLSGQFAAATDTSGNSLFTIAFDKNTFSVASRDSSVINGVGSYTYVSYGYGANLKLTYAAPPSAKAKTAKTARTVGLYFSTPASASFSTPTMITTNLVVLTTNNTVITTNLVSTNMTVNETGNLQFSSAANLAFANASNQLIWTAGSEGNADGLLFHKTTYTSQALLSADTNAGTYTYTQYSPVGSLFKLTGSNDTSYVVATFADTNHGSYYEENYTASGETNGTDNGHFVVASEKPPVAPLSLTNLDLHVFNGDGDFDEQFGPDTYSQTSPTTNYDTDVGSYTYTTYANPDAFIGDLNLTVTQPPVLAGSNSAARLIFVGGNVGLFTNDDGTVSTFATSPVTNLVPASIATNTLNLTYFYYFLGYRFSGVNPYQFDTNGNFTFNGTNSGTYSYQPFSPTVAMMQLNYITNGVGTNGTGLDWLQLNFSTTNSGNYLNSRFDTDTNFLGNTRNTFTIQ